RRRARRCARRRSEWMWDSSSCPRVSRDLPQVEALRRRGSSDAVERLATLEPSIGEMQMISGMPTSIPLEPPHQLPIGDAAVVLGLLPLGRVHVVLDDGVA